MKEKFIKHLNYCEEKLNEINVDSVNTRELNKKIKTVELLVPVIGSYSAGKTKFINGVIGKNCLIEGIRPETALATEIRYSPSEYFIGIKENGEKVKFELNEVEKIRDRAEEFSYSQLYINSELIRKIEPFILVDMPGFNSPKEAHNKAILEYIDKGVHYIVLVSVEDGTINKSTLLQLDPLLSYNKTFDIFLSKSNLKRPEDVQKLKENIEETVYEFLGSEVEVIPLYDKINVNSEKILYSFNQDKAYLNKFRNEIFANNNNIINNLEILEKTINKDKEQKIEEIEELEDLINDLQKSRDKNIDKMKNKYGAEALNKIVNSVSETLYSIKDELVSLAMRGSETTLKHKINEVVESKVLMEVKECMSYISKDITEDIKLDFSFDNTLNSSITNNLIDTMGDFVLNKISSSQFSNTATNISSSIGIGSLLKGIFKSILGIFSLAFPILIDFLKGKNSENNKKSEIEQKIIVDVIPEIKHKLKINLKEMIDNHIEKLIEKVYEEFEKDINVKREMIDKIKEEMSSEDNTKYLNVIKELKSECKAINEFIKNKEI